MGRLILPIPNILNAILSTFIAILMIRITYPIIEPIMDLWETSMMKAAAFVGMWLIYFFVLYVITWQLLFKKDNEEEDTKKTKG